MRAQARRITHEEEEESAFVSMTDMTVGFLFIIMILLAFFASQIRDTDDVVSRFRFETVQQERDKWRDLAEQREEKITQLELEIGALKDERSRLNTLVSKLRSELAERDREIERLKAELARLKQIDPLENYLARVADVRRQVLTRLRDALRRDFPDLQVELSEESDALRFRGEGLFASSSPNLTRQKRVIVAKLAERLDEVLPCYTIGETSEFSESCNPGFVMIEAVQIEGHTDNEGDDSYNRTLSTNRANSTFFEMTRAARSIMLHKNLKQQPVLSVAAYGPDRPVASNDTPTGRATNRRIDLRFIMVTPQDNDGIGVIRDALQAVTEAVE